MLYIKRLCFFFIYCTSSKTLFFRSYKLAEHINITHPIFSNETNGNVHPVIKINQNIWTETICIFASGHLVDLSVHLCMWWCCCFLLIFDVLMFFLIRSQLWNFILSPLNKTNPEEYCSFLTLTDLFVLNISIGQLGIPVNRAFIKMFTFFYR